MPENENVNVKMDEYNKVVEAHNQLKVEKEKIETELKGLREQKKEDDTKKVWETEKQNFQKQIDDMNKKLEEAKIQMQAIAAKPKGIVQETAQTDRVQSILDKEIPEPKVDANKIPSHYGKLRHFKSNVTREFTREQLGKALNLHGIAQKTNPEIIPLMARDGPQNDIVFNKR